MRAVVLYGSENGDAVAEDLRELLVHELVGASWEVQPFILHELEIRHCVGCFGCWIQTPGVCRADDVSRDIAKAIVQSDLVVYVTPVTFGGYSSQLKKVLDRTICIVSPFFTRIDGEIHHRPRYDHYPRLLGLGLLPGPNTESERIFTTLISRNAINMHAPAHSGGVIYRDQGKAEMQEKIHALLKALEVSS